MNRNIFIILFVLLLFSSCKGEKARNIEYDDINRLDYQSNLNDEKKLSDMKIRIDYQKPELVYNKTSVEKEVDNKFCNLTYDLKITNLNDKPIEIIAKFFFTKKMYDTFQLSRESFGTEGGEVILEPSQGIYIAAGPMIKHTDNYTEKEHSLFREEFEKLEAILIINNQEYYFLLDGDDTVDSIYEN